MKWQTTRFEIDLSTPSVMGILNITPDSFAVRHNEGVAATLKVAEQMLLDGAKILDIGAESTRPGAAPVPFEEEWRRLEPILVPLLQLKVPISIDTYKAATMQRALDLGADIINDVWGLRQEGALEVVSRYPQSGICVMHMHAQPQTMQLTPLTEDTCTIVDTFFTERLSALKATKINKNRIALDVGIGFGKTPAQNMLLLKRHADFMRYQCPLLIGWSRKSTLGIITNTQHTDERLIPSVVAATLAVERGANIVRVHDVKETVQALQVFNALQNTQ